jgi:hypothetical protein
VSSSRRTVCKALLAALALPLACRGGPGSDADAIRRAPRLRLSSGGPADPADPALVARMFVASVPERRLAALVGDIRAAGRTIAIRDAMGPGLDADEDRAAALASVRAGDLLPVLTAAATLAAGAWASPALGMTARAIAARGAAPADLPAWGAAEPASSQIEHLRFTAWALTRAAVIGVAPGRASAAREQLAARAVSPASAIALFCSGAKIPPRRPEPALDKFCEQADPGAPLSALVCALAKGSDGAPALPAWLDLANDEWMVVPKLGTLSSPERFAAEVSEIASDLGARPIVRPAPR